MQTNYKSVVFSNDTKHIVNFLQEKQLIPTKPPICRKCNKDMKLTEKKGLGDIYLWRCSTCGCSSSIRNKSFFSSFDIALAKIMQIIFYWCLQLCQVDIEDLVEVSQNRLRHVTTTGTRYKVLTISKFNENTTVVRNDLIELANREIEVNEHVLEVVNEQPKKSKGKRGRKKKSAN
ncbi:unnamed protein product [Brachionus calyciflorus]|uniref:Uncharacterized protein n=1 Tax=Brachionus calyciflorus TaxID=104777 RepID=A0A814I597_9BILA|nr:unnamed protein product [Brachionus calyciflorus]